VKFLATVTREYLHIHGSIKLNSAVLHCIEGKMMRGVHGENAWSLLGICFHLQDVTSYSADVTRLTNDGYNRACKKLL